MSQRDTFFSKKIVFMSILLTFLIVVMHSETPERYGQELSWSTYPFILTVFIITKIAVPLFFFISALLFYRNCEWKDLPDKLYRRVFSLLIPFLIWNILFASFYVLLDHIPYIASRMNRGSGIHDIGDFINAVIETKFTPLWFVKYLIIYNIASPLILVVIKNKWVGLAAVIALFFYCVYYNMGYFSLVHWLPIYLLGAMVGRHIYAPGQQEIAYNRNKLLLPFSASILLASLIMAFAGGRYIIYYEFFGALSLWFIIDFLFSGYISNMKIKKWMGCMFMIYAMHYMVINIIEGGVRATLPHTSFVLNATFVITPFVTFWLIIKLSAFLSRFGFYKYLSGGRG